MTTSELAMSTCDEKAWAEIQEWRLKRLEARERGVLNAARNKGASFCHRPIGQGQ